ncbi:hypothetical protein, conserved [Eimeria tenella]|uniref:Uncharacterized protein n=1 Tax=Eimeria tenella TaxID=5802 RepID=U6KTM4_EIMTE|nr:hypothetical protein, conserved [Eimeria tenella]CDJ41321.1 hypothetical protein, conserved [Eimeria tenella]|eukprot:XP_013232071.1 hypothetical protein, conserved [Eimeria tenella]
MERLLSSSICSLAYGSLAEGRATVDTHLLALCRPHYKPPSAIFPVASYVLPLPQYCFSSRSREVCDILFTPHSPSLALACTSENDLLTFDMNCGSFISEIQLSPGSGANANNGHRRSCTHINRDPGAPLIFSGAPNGDVMVFDARTSGITAKLLGQKFCPTLRLPSAHDGAVCGIGTGIALHPQLFLTGGREDRWLRLFDLRFPFHYSSAGSSNGDPVAYPLEARRLGPSEDHGAGWRTCFKAFDVSPDGSLLAGSVARHRTAEPTSMDRKLQGTDGETVLLSLSDGLRTVKTIASADACAAEYVQFSPNAKYILQTGGVGGTFCKMCWHCECRCLCVSKLRQEQLDKQANGTTESHYSVSDIRGWEKNVISSSRSTDELESSPQETGITSYCSRAPYRCMYHRAQLVNLVQSNRTINLKSPADGAVAFTDSFCLSHSFKGLQQHAAQLDWPRYEGLAKDLTRPVISAAAGNGSFLRILHFTLQGPTSRYAHKCRQRFWKYLAKIQSSATTPTGHTSSGSKAMHREVKCGKLRPVMRPTNGRDMDCAHSGGDMPLCMAGAGTHDSVRTTPQIEEAAVDKSNAVTKPLLFPLLHPQLSQFISSCGPLHPAFVRAEAATSPFKCRLWGGLVVGYGGSTADGCGGARIYDGLKLWDSTTGVVLSWTEGDLAREDNLTCIAPVPDTSNCLLATGGYHPVGARNCQSSSPSSGLTFWSLRRRDDLIMYALEGSLSLEVESEDSEASSH